MCVYIYTHICNYKQMYTWVYGDLAELAIVVIALLPPREAGADARRGERLAFFWPHPLQHLARQTTYLRTLICTGARRNPTTCGTD